MEQLPMMKLLDEMVGDNPTYKFPIELIRDELRLLILDSMEFDYFMMRIYSKLNITYGKIYAQLFLDVINRFTNYASSDIHDFDRETYQELIDNAITYLEGIKLTRIDKNSPDGEVLLTMAQQD